MCRFLEIQNKDTLIYMEPAIQVAQETLWRLNKAEKVSWLVI